MARKNVEGRRHGEAKCVFVPLSKDVAEIVDAAATQLGLSRSNLARILLLNFAALVREKGDPFAAFLAASRLMGESPAKSPAAGDVEPRGLIWEDESRKKAVEEVGAGG